MKNWFWGALGIFILAILVARITFVSSEIKWDEYFRGFSIEAAGKVYDIILMVIVFGGYDAWRQRQEKEAEAFRHKRDRVEEFRRRIDDLKRIDDDYAKAMIGSSLRGLKELGVVAPYDFRGMQLSNISISTDFDIEDISGSIFADGIHMAEFRKNYTKLDGFNFIHVNCTGVKFSTGNLSLAKYINCSFIGSNLKNASFAGAHMTWSTDTVVENRDNWYEHEEEDDGTSVIQKYYPPFSGADLTGANFDNCWFLNADFRDVDNIIEASFKNVHGINTCFFDGGILAQLTDSGRLTIAGD